MVTPIAVGPIKTIRVPFAASIAVDVGDILYRDASAHTVKPAAVIDTATFDTLAKAQEGVHDAFAGISQDKRMASQTAAADGLSAAAGRISMPCADDATAYDIGTLYGVNATLANNVYTPVSQQVAVVATDNLAIGRLVKQAAAHCTSVVLEIVGTVFSGGPQTAI